MLTLKPYLAGRFIETDTPWVVKAPYDGAEIVHTFLVSSTHIEEAITAAEQVRPTLAALTSGERSNFLQAIAAGIEQQFDLFAVTLAREAAKPLYLANVEVQRAIANFKIAAEETKRWPHELMDMDWVPAGSQKQGLLRYVPAGIVAGISPFNFPLNLAVHKIAPAMAAGCPIILKPATATPLSTLLLAQVIDSVGWPAGGVSVLPCSRQVGQQLVTDNRIAVLSFTGSDEVGWKLQAQAGKKRTVMELGGNAGAIIHADSDWESHMPKLVQGAFAYAGQICIHTQRFFVHTSHFNSFVDALRAQAQQLRFGAPEAEDTQISVMIDEANAIRAHDWVHEAVAQGAHLITGGVRQQAYLQPTMLTHTTPHMKVNAEEVFAPVVTITPYTHFDEALAALNTSRFGLQAGVFTHDERLIKHAFNTLEVGAILVNEVPTLRIDHMPYGGVKDSGHGREGVRYAMRDMLEPRFLMW